LNGVFECSENYEGKKHMCHLSCDCVPPGKDFEDELNCGYCRVCNFFFEPPGYGDGDGSPYIP